MCFQAGKKSIIIIKKGEMVVAFLHSGRQERSEANQAEEKKKTASLSLSLSSLLSRSRL